MSQDDSQIGGPMALAPDTIPETGPWASDYARMAEAIAYLEKHGEDQPSLGETASHLGLSPFHFQRLFTRWAGVSPKQFLKLLTHAHARTLLERDETVLETSFASGLSGPGRLHDLCVSVEAMTPGEIRSGGAGLEIAYGFHDSPFGECLILACSRGVTGLAFCGVETRVEALEDMTQRWPKAVHRHDPETTAALVEMIFPRTPETLDSRTQTPLKLLIGGTAFQMQVWQALLRIPPGEAISYTDLAHWLGREKAQRAVGGAVGRNPISYLIPCHRVLRQSAALGGYHWGLTRKRAILAFEGARADCRVAS